MTLRPEDIDPQLLALLRADARRNVSELAASIGVSRTAIYSSIDRLERLGTIVGYTVRLGEDYDRSLIRAHVMVKLYPKATQTTIDQLMTIPAVGALYAVSGEHDLIVMIEARHVNQLNDLLDEIGAMEGVERTTSSVILATKLQR
ncbi:MAG: Lrp/AsnC family transcriptional regulator [Sphingomonas sp.]